LATSQLNEQLDYIALDKPSAADRMAGLIQESTALLASWPELGKPGKLPETRELGHSPNTLYRGVPDTYTN
jgi:toxin ParE1/3/4